MMVFFFSFSSHVLTTSVAEDLVSESCKIILGHYVSVKNKWSEMHVKLNALYGELRGLPKKDFALKIKTLKVTNHFQQILFKMFNYQYDDAHELFVKFPSSIGVKFLL